MESLEEEGPHRLLVRASEGPRVVREPPSTQYRTCYNQKKSTRQHAVRSPLKKVPLTFPGGTPQISAKGNS